MAVASTDTNAGAIQEEEEVNDHLDVLFKRFWALEEMTSAEARPISNGVNECEEHFLQTTVIGADGRYVVRLPFKKRPIILGDSFEQAKRRLLFLEKGSPERPTCTTSIDNFWMNTAYWTTWK